MSIDNKLFKIPIKKFEKYRIRKDGRLWSTLTNIFLKSKNHIDSLDNYYDFDGRRYSHIISPKTGYPVENKIISVSVFSKECLNADALATALMVMDIEDGIDLIEQLDEYESFFILEDNSARYTSGIKDFLH